MPSQQRVRVVAQRGKSMEELGASKLTRLSALSKSSEQLDQMSRHSSGPAGLDRDKRSVSSFAEVRNAQVQGKQYVTRDIVGQRKTQGQPQNQTQRKSLLKQNSDPEQDASAGTRNSSRSTSPASRSSSRARVHSGSPGSHGVAADELRSSRPSEASFHPPSPRGPDISEGESSPTQTKLPFESRPGSR